MVLRLKCISIRWASHPLSNAKELEARANKKTDKGVHVDVALELDKGVIAFADGRPPRARARMEIAGGLPAVQRTRHRRDVARVHRKAFAELTGKSRRPLKEFLLDQSKIAGVGNIYSCEALWHAKISPFRLANSLKPNEARGLYKAIVSVLRRALQLCLNPAPGFQRCGVVVSGNRRHPPRLPTRRRTL